MTMACFARLGRELRQSLVRKVAFGSNTGFTMQPTLCVLSRGMASSRLFVGGLSWGTDEEMLRESFSAYGSLTEVKIINDRDTGRSRGFGFVNFTSEEDAETAQKAIDGQNLGGRIVRVKHATSPGSGPYGGVARGFGLGGGGGEFSGEDGTIESLHNRTASFSDEGGSGSTFGGFGTGKTEFGQTLGRPGGEQKVLSLGSARLGREPGEFGSGFGGLSSEQSRSDHNSRELNFEGTFSPRPGEVRSSGGSNFGATVGNSETFGHDTDLSGNGRTLFGQTSKDNFEGMSSFGGQTLGAENHSPFGSGKDGGFAQAVGLGTDKTTLGQFGTQGGEFGQAFGGFGPDDGGVSGRNFSGYGGPKSGEGNTTIGQKGFGLRGSSNSEYSSSRVEKDIGHVSRSVLGKGNDPIGQRGFSFDGSTNSEYGSPRKDFASVSRAILGEGNDPIGQKGFGIEGSSNNEYGSPRGGKDFASVSRSILGEGNGTFGQKGFGLEGGPGMSTRLFDSDGKKDFGSNLGSFDSNLSTDSWTGLNRISGGFSNKARRMRRAAGGVSMNSTSLESWKSLGSSYGSLFSETSKPSESSSAIDPDFLKELDAQKGSGSELHSDSSGPAAPTTNVSADSSDWRTLLNSTLSEPFGLGNSTKETSLDAAKSSNSTTQISFSSPENWRRLFDSVTAPEVNSPSSCRIDGSDVDSTEETEEIKASFSDNWRNLIA